MVKVYFCLNFIHLLIGVLFIKDIGVHGLRCYCDHHCPENHENYTCISEYKCFTSIEMVKGTKDTEIKFGCMPPEDSGGMFQCRSKYVRHEIPMKVECCNDGDLCNEYLNPTLPPEEVGVYMQRISEPRTSLKHVSHTHVLALIISVTVCVMLLVIAITYFYLRYRQIATKQKHDAERKVFILNGRSRINSVGELLDNTSIAAVPLLNKRTIAKEIKFCEEIGRGRYSTVFKGRWREQVIAIKVVDSCDEKSWQRELQIFQTAYMCHENILGFIAADIVDCNPTQALQRIVVTEYQPYGSLHDFLQAHSFDYRILFRLAYSAINGLSYSHRMVTGSRGKPAIAHRDVTSKNILVKENLQCCLSDFGLAIKLDPETNDIEHNENPRLPTMRYMAPEIIEKPDVICYTFDTYQKSDVYAFGLVLWEIARRYEIKGTPEEYTLPFSDHVSDIPSLTEMHDVVILNQITPKLPSRYEDDQHSKVLIKLMKECWHFQPSARLTSQYLKKSLQKCLQDQDSEKSIGSSTGTASTSIS